MMYKAIRKKEEGRRKKSIRMMLTMNRGLERGMVSLVKEMCGLLLERMAERDQLKCSVEEGMRHLEGMGSVTTRAAAKKKAGGESKAEVVGKPGLALPFCGVINDEWCLGVRWNHGLHSQCTNSRDGLGDYCTTCKKGAENSASGKPPFGDMRERAKFGLDYRDPKGKQTICYANVAEKLGIDLEKAKEEARKFGWEIPEDQLVKAARKRGRPSKKSGGTVVVKKKRGRKKKTPDMADKIAELVSQASGEISSPEEKSSEVYEMKKRRDEAAAKLRQMKELIKQKEVEAVAAVDSSDDEGKEAEAAAVKEGGGGRKTRKKRDKRRKYTIIKRIKHKMKPNKRKTKQNNKYNSSKKCLKKKVFKTIRKR